MKQMKQTTKNKLTLYIFLAAIAATFFIPFESPWVRTGVALLIVLLYFFIRRAFIYFVRGARKFEKNDDRCWALFKKAINARIPSNQALYIATAFIKQNDVDYGISIVRDIVAKQPDTDDGHMAAVTLSMGLWVKNDLEQAIKILKDLQAGGYTNRTLEINLSTYLLEHGDVDEALKVIRKAEENGMLNHGMLDNKLWALIVRNKWDECQPLVTELMDERKPRFPEAYLHCAQVMVHQGRLDQAVTYLRSGAEQKFTNNGSMDQKYLNDLIDALSDPQRRLAWAQAIDDNPVAVASGRAFDVDENGGKNFKVVDEGVAQKALKAKKQAEARDKKKVYDDLDDDREPNTDLNEDDLTPFEDDTAVAAGTVITDDDLRAMDTSVGDDDDREPNTDVN